MRISQRVRATWEGKLFKKGTLCLAAIGILGGFFVAYAEMMANTITVTAPASSAYWNDTKAITWATDKCAVGDNLAILVEDANNNDQVVYTMVASCSVGTKDLVTGNISDGRYKIMVYRMVEGATDSGYSGVFTIDNQVPDITTETLITPDGGELWGGTKKTISWNAGAITDANIGTTPISLYYSIGGATPVLIASNEANDGSYDWTLPTGVNYTNVTVQIVATDLAGNKSSDASDTVFAIDTVAPDVSITLISSQVKGGAVQTLAWTGSEANASTSVEYFNGSVWTAATVATDGKWTVPALNINNAQIKVSITDAAGNTGVGTSNVFMIDSTAAKATFASANEYFGPVSFADRTFAGAVSDGSGSGTRSVKVIIKNETDADYCDGTGWQANKVSVAAGLNGGNWTYLLPTACGLENGDLYGIVAIATDVVGNEDVGATGDSMTYDDVKPALAITAPTATLTKVPAQTISGTITETNPDMIKVNDVALKGGEVTSTGFSKNVTLAEGSNSYTVIATDKAGNSDTETIAITLDTKAPIVTVAPLITDNNTPTISGTVSDAAASLAVSAGSVNFTVAKSGTTWTATAISALVDAKYNVLVTATDEATNVGSDTTIDELVVDTTAPTIDDFSLPVADAVFTTTSATANVPLAFVANDAMTAITCSYQIDGAGTVEAISCTSPVSVPVPDGRHTVTVTVKDAVNKVASATSASFVVNADNILTVGKSGAEYTSIAAAIAAAKDLDTIKVVDSATYTEPLVVDKDLSFVALTSSVSPVATHPVIANGMTIAANGVSIDGFTIQNPNGITGVYSTGVRSDVSITNNTLTNIGTAADHGAAVYFQGKTTNITVKGNHISNIGKNTATVSSKGIFFGDSNSTGTSENLDISDNDISGVFSGTKGAYGILINFGSAKPTGSTVQYGSLVKVKVYHNTISGIAGNWSTAIGMEAITANATVTENTIGSLGNIPVGISVEDNTSAGSIEIKKNSFNSSIIGVANKVSGSTVIARENWWGASTKPQAKIFGSVDFTPWYLNEAMSKLSSNASLSVDDDAPTSAPADFTKIQDAIDAVASAGTADATINVATGIYNENIVVPAGVVGLNISGHDKTDTSIKVNSGDAVTLNSPATIKKFTIDCQGVGKGKDGIHINGGTGTLIDGNNISNYTEEGILIDGGTSTISNNVINGIGDAIGYSTDSIYTKNAATVTVSENTLSGNYYHPVQATTGGDYSTAAGISVHAGDNVTLTGNTITNNTFGIHVKGAASVSATENQISNNGQGYTLPEYRFGFFHETAATPSVKFDASHNWWGSGKKSDIEGLVSVDSVNFVPWHLDADGTPDSGTDSTGPSVVLEKSIAGSFVKNGNIITIFATLNDGTGAGVDTSVAPIITITNGSVASANLIAGMVKEMNETGWTGRWKYDWTVPNITGVISSAVTVKAYDIIGNEGTSAEMSFVNDNYAPFFNLSSTGQNYGVDAGPVKGDFISIYDIYGGANYFNTVLASAEYGFSDDAAKCNSASYSGSGVTVSGNTVSFTVTGDHHNYLCVKATDGAGNVGYQAIGGDSGPVPAMNVDNTVPSGYSVNINQSYINNSNKTALSFTFAAAEVGAIYNYSINDNDSATAAVVGNGAIATLTDTVSGINVSSLVDGILTLSVTLTDGAQNVGAVAKKTGIDVLPTVMKDVEAPVIASHDDVEVAAISAAAQAVIYTAPVVTDNIDALSAATCTPASGSSFSFGDTTVSCTKTDAAGNAATSTTFKVSVKDKTAPVIAAHVDVEVAAISAEPQVVDYTAPNATDNVDATAAAVCTPASGSLFNNGETTVNCTKTDAAGNAAIPTSFKVLVEDETVPVIAAHGNVIAERANAAGATVEYVLPVVTDNVSTGLTATCLPVSGSVFPFGYTTIECNAKDRANNSAVETTFIVSVVDTKSPDISDMTPSGIISIMNPVVGAKFTDASVIDVSGVVVSLTGGALVLNNDYFVITPTGITSNTSGIVFAKNTTYTISVSGLKDSLENVTPVKTWSFIVNNNAIEADTTKPTILASSPEDGATGIMPNANPTITFSEKMKASTVTSGNIRLVKYASDGSDVVAAAVTLSDDGTKATIDPTVVLAKGTQYYLFVSGDVEDLVGNKLASAWTDGDKASHEFTTVSNSFTISLKQGWNLISLPLIPDDNTIADVLAGTNLADVDIVEYYDTISNDWKTYTPNLTTDTDDLATMVDGKAYWVFMKNVGSLTVTGKTNSITPLTYFVPANEWTMIGFKSTTKKKVSEYLPVSQMSADDQVLSFDGIVDDDFYYTELDLADGYLLPGTGYWIYTQNPKGLSISAN